MYVLIRWLLFLLDPETAHHFSLSALKLLHRLGLARLMNVNIDDNPVSVIGLTFRHNIGLAAGLDKNGDYIESLFLLGFAFVEVGTVTPKAQRGKPKPRLFRLQEDQALINRMGFNNKGIDYLVNEVKRLRVKGPLKGILGINIGKNASTPLDMAHEDYIICLKKAYPVADYITVNISSPNTPGLRQLQGNDYLDNLLKHLLSTRDILAKTHKKRVPLLVKIAPDLNIKEINAFAKALITHNVDGVIATNTTISRPTLKGGWAAEKGGLSGQPLHALSTGVVRELAIALDGKIPIIGVGGIMSAKDANNMLECGAALLQLYTGLIYKGPRLLRKIVNRA